MISASLVISSTTRPSAFESQCLHCTQPVGLSRQSSPTKRSLSISLSLFQVNFLNSQVNGNYSYKCECVYEYASRACVEPECVDCICWTTEPTVHIAQQLQPNQQPNHQKRVWQSRSCVRECLCVFIPSSRASPDQQENLQLPARNPVHIDGTDKSHCYQFPHPV